MVTVIRANQERVVARKETWHNRVEKNNNMIEIVKFSMFWVCLSPTQGNAQKKGRYKGNDEGNKLFFLWEHLHSCI